MNVRIRCGLTALLALSLAGPAAAQDDDWEFIERRGTVAAAVSFDSGLAVAVRCDDENLETYIAGLAPTDVDEHEPRRTIDYAFGDRPLRASTWQISRDGQVLFADLPAPLARRFREGGALQLRLAAEGSTPARRYVVSLPPSPAAIDRVLTACGRPTVDPRDTLRRDEASTDATRTAPTRPGPTWARAPQATYPDRALEAGLSGMAVVSCLVQDGGRLDACQVEVERPSGADFGRFALRASRDARLIAAGDAPPGSPSEGMVTFTIRWNVMGR